MAWSDAAREAARLARMHNVRLFHGTTDRIARVTPQPYTGRDKGIYLSTVAGDARMHASQTARQKGGNPVVHMVRARSQPHLRVTSGTGKKGTRTWYITDRLLNTQKIYKVKKWV